MDTPVFSEPGSLPFGIAARRNLDLLDRICKGLPPVESGNDLLVPNCLRRGNPLTQALVKQALNLVDKPGGDHGIDTMPNPLSKDIGIDRKPKENSRDNLRDGAKPSLLLRIGQAFRMKLESSRDAFHVGRLDGLSAFLIHLMQTTPQSRPAMFARIFVAGIPYLVANLFSRWELIAVNRSAHVETRAARQDDPLSP